SPCGWLLRRMETRSAVSRSRAGAPPTPGCCRRRRSPASPSAPPTGPGGGEADEGIGFARVGASREDEDGDGEREGELYAIYLDPRCWGRDIGKALLLRAEESLRGSGFRRAVLYVLEGNERAQRFYRAAGWEQYGSKLDDFQGATV